MRSQLNSGIGVDKHTRSAPTRRQFCAFGKPKSVRFMHTLIIVVFSIHFALAWDSLVSIRTNYRFYYVLRSFSVHFDRWWGLRARAGHWMGSLRKEVSGDFTNYTSKELLTVSVVFFLFTASSTRPLPCSFFFTRLSSLFLRRVIRLFCNALLFRCSNSSSARLKLDWSEKYMILQFKPNVMRWCTASFVKYL